MLTLLQSLRLLPDALLSNDSYIPSNNLQDEEDILFLRETFSITFL